MPYSNSNNHSGPSNIRQIATDNVDKNQLQTLRDHSISPPTHVSTPYLSAQSTYTHRPDLYTYNSLNSFSFGSVQPSSSSRSVNPLDGDDDFLAPADVTPRPSVVGPHPLNKSYHSHAAQPPGLPPGDPPPPRSSPRMSRVAVYLSSNPDTASRHTFGTSSASASVTSLSSASPSNSALNSRAGSRTSRHTSTTSQTSPSDLTDDDDNDDHRHPIPPHHNLHRQHLDHVQHPPGLSNSNGAAVEFSSDEDYDSDYDYDDYYDDDAGMEIEISSAMYEGSVLADSAPEWERRFYGYGSGSSGSVRATLGYGERRGSGPIAIPGAGDGAGITGMDDAFFPVGRAREDSIATLRRPSRSLDDDLKMIGPTSSGSGSAQGAGLSRHSPPAPASVPETDGDWRSLHERSREATKAKEGGANNTHINQVALPQLLPPISPPSLVGGTSRTPVGNTNVTSPNTTHHPSAMDEFDLDWSSLQQGIVFLDQSQVADIIRVPDPQLMQVTSGFSSGATDSRRASTTRWLNMFGVGGDNSRRPSAATVSSLHGGDSFGRAVGKWGGDEYRAQRRDWSFRREKADRTDGLDARNALGIVKAASTIGGGFLSPRGSMMTERSGMVVGEHVNSSEREKGRSEKEKEKEKGRERERERENEREERDVKVVAATWKGMHLNTQELWKNDLVGRFKVDRRSAKPPDSSKGLQQRLVIQHFRDPYASFHRPHSGPPVTIHKHSKAKAFSISRHYRPKFPTSHPVAASRDGAVSNKLRDSGLHGSGSSRYIPSRVGTTPSSKILRNSGDALEVSPKAGGLIATASKKSNSMILLAPRRVQVAFTSTTTTRKLESHGLLDEHDGLIGPRDREREREKERDTRRKAAEEKAKPKRRRQKEKEEEVGSRSSSAGSVIGGSTTKVAAGFDYALPSPPLPPPSSVPANSGTPLAGSPGVFHNGSSSVSRTSSRTSRRRRHRDPLDDSDDSDSPPSRTPHSEAYGTMDASLIEQLRPRHDRPHHISDFDPNAGLWKRVFRGRSTHLPGPSPGQLEAHYDPPWMILASRNKQEQQQRVVENLNTSFKDVGLLPSTHKDKTKHTQSSQKQTKIASGTSQMVDIFEEVPPDSLYMLLPLWPGDTDPVSERRAGSSYQKPHIPSEQRQYLLVYYKPTPEAANAEQDPTKSRTEGEAKKKSRGSPTSSHESKRDDGRGVLLSSFHISARLVSYKDLQGSGVRVPDEGLTVAGPLSMAFDTMPSSVRNEGLFDWVIGMCHSREAGIEFYPEGLVKMGLCLITSAPPDTVSEVEEPPEPTLELTPVGRAVLEMAWLGCMALTSFGP